MNDVSVAPFKMGGEDRLLASGIMPYEIDMFPHTGQRTISVVEKLNAVFVRAVKEKIADVHFKRIGDEYVVRFRMPGGTMDIVDHFSLEEFVIVDDKIRSRSNIITSDFKHPHDSRMSLSTGYDKIDVRVAISPGVETDANISELIVCRILNQKNSRKELDDIDMPLATREAISRIIDEPTGLFLVTGPTGSGKTTTLYAILNELNDGTRNILTIENPVEYRVDEFHQIPVDGKSLTFASGLRAALRQDPDVIMVGEIRDKETAEIAIQAALTGHLVLSTLHSNSAAGAITRLIDFGIDASALSASLRGVSAQRLIRTLSPFSNLPVENPSDEDKAWLKAANVRRVEPLYPVGMETDREGNSIYRGVTPIMEVIIVDQRVKRVLKNGEAAIYKEASRQPQFESLAQAAERIAFAKATTLYEARRVASIHDAPTIANKRLGQLLVEKRKISEEDMNSLLNLQAQWRSEGKQKKLGKMLVEGEHCTEEELYEAIGYTAEAHDIMLKLCGSEDEKQELATLIRKWTPGVDSLFDIVVANGMFSMEEIVNACND